MKSHGVEYQPDSVAADLAGVRLSRAAAPPQSHRYNIICGVHLTNRFILWVSAISFTLFVAAEIVGAIFGNSLALLGDAAAMSVDVIAYFSNMYAEHIKETEGVISVGKQMLLDIYIPGVSVCGLLAVTVYVLIETIDVLLHPTPEDAVDVYFLYGFASANFVIDVLCISLFAARGSGALLEEKEVLDPLTSTKQPTELRESELGANYAATDSDVGRVEHSVRSFGYAEGVRAEVSPQHRVKDDGNEDDNSEAEFEAAMILSKNINMMSALTHVSGDTLRTVSVFVSAIVASVTDVPTSVCDAWAAVVVSLTILGIVIPLLREILLSVTKHCCKISTSALDNEYGL